MKRVIQIALILLFSCVLVALVYLRISSVQVVAETEVNDSTDSHEIIEDIIVTPPIIEDEKTAVITIEPTLEPVMDIDPYDDKPDINIMEWEYILANTDHLLNKDFIPDLTELEYGNYFDSRAVDALKLFIQGARDEGLSVYLTSSYRSYSMQEYLFNNKVQQYGGDREAAARIVAIPGSSEHQTGLAADIVDQHYEYMNESLADTALSKWMYEHCAEYGFILRFPEDKQDITGIMFEPWHFRYVGEEAAKYIMDNNLCLEEFVSLYQ